MAAYAALVSLARTIHLILQNHHHSIFFHEFNQEIKHLLEQSTLLQAFLEDFPDGDDDGLQARIRDVAYEAEDAIQDFLSKQIESGLNSARGSRGVGLQRDQDNISDVFQRLQKVTEGIDSIVELVKSAKNSSKRKDLLKHTDSSSASSSSAPTAGRDVVVGFEDDLMAIKLRLCGQSSKLQVVPIVGMGGIVSIEPSDENQGDELLENVYKGLKGKRYLIVMDDMWSTKAWDDVKMIFPDDDNGSRIIVTTRLLDVASYVDSSSTPPHEMHFLDEDQSWNLLRQIVFKQEECPAELEKIGKMIARSCGGLPLAIVVIAGLLSTIGKTLASWENIARNVNQAVTTNYEQFEKILSLSYINLPQHLRMCFLYMGGFPEDYEIHVWKLIKLWVAEGFIKPSGSKSFEEEAEEYLEDLVKRSLVLVTKRKTNGKIKICGVHDLVRDLCIRKAEEEKFLHRYIGKMLHENIKYQHRISLMHFDLNSLENMYGSTIRTIMCFNCRNTSPTYSEFCSFMRNFRLLKILDVVYSSTIHLFPEVYELFHLRYLAVDYHTEIPASISNLRNLQTLILHQEKRFKSYGPWMIRLPSEIWKISQLRHLVSFVFGRLPDPEEGTFPLENLQTLSEIRDFRCTEKILKMLPNLKKLGVSYIIGENDQDYHLDNLIHFRQLQKLKVKIYPSFLFRLKLNPVFPPSLKKLTLSGWHRPWEDMGIVGSLPNLEVLKLRDYAFRGYKWETSEEEFRCLKFLVIDKSDLQHWITESNHFPNLRCLVLYRCWCLNEIPYDFGEIPTLELIKVDDGNISVMDSARQIQEVQQSWGNDILQVRIGRYNTLTGDIE
ncbi:putative late blight resistance proteinR1B-16 [Sesamum alatum]|uniref:Late blight resistance proteinR1B-16 n=1 Tax=Sesamum alatum TaxID=300844 RepID=A0AAE1YMS5_9LAMI|nr:putative late blight resistance proteinR1B-16 [Sesamum alatum]